MATAAAHRKQAQHNEQLAELLANSHIEYKDWLITCCFYAAVHYVEEKLYSMPVVHGDSSVPPKQPGVPDYTIHDWRQNLVFLHFRLAFKSYRELRNASKIARYLPTDASVSATDYFTDEQAVEFLKTHLQRVKSQL